MDHGQDRNAVNLANAAQPDFAIFLVVISPRQNWSLKYAHGGFKANPMFADIDPIFSSSHSNAIALCNHKCSYF